MNNRVVITGLGVLSPIGNDLETFKENLLKGKVGYKRIDILADYGFRGLVGGLIEINFNQYEEIFNFLNINNSSRSIKLSVVCAIQAIKDAKLEIDIYKEKEPDNDTGIIIGSTVGQLDFFREEIFKKVHAKNIRKLRSWTAEYMMNHAPSAVISAITGYANYVGYLSSACATGGEVIAYGYKKIKYGEAKRMLVGAIDYFDPYTWCAFEALRITATNYNDEPNKACRPLSKSSDGIVISEGCGFMVLENYEEALKRNVPIYAEIVGAAINSGAQRNGGSMTASNPKQLISCIKNALNEANIQPSEIDYINGHLTGTINDPIEIKCWAEALDRYYNNFPYINATKSILGHCQAAAGILESIATILQMKYNFIHPSINSEDILPEILNIVPRDKIPLNSITNANINYSAKSSLGFGDVNVVLIFKKF